MTTRPHISTRTRVDVAIAQAGGWIICPLCAGPLRPDDERVLEHLVPHELGGSSESENLRWVHEACARRKTNGRGDLHKIAKAKRLATAREAHEAVLAGAPKTPGKIKSRGFDRTFRRKLNGKTERRQER